MLLNHHEVSRPSRILFEYHERGARGWRQRDVEYTGLSKGVFFKDNNTKNRAEGREIVESHVGYKMPFGAGSGSPTFVDLKM